MILQKKFKVTIAGPADFLPLAGNERVLLVGSDSLVKEVLVSSGEILRVEDQGLELSALRVFRPDSGELMALSSDAVCVFNLEDVASVKKLLERETGFKTAEASEKYILLLGKNGELEAFDRLTSTVRPVKPSSGAKIADIGLASFDKDLFFWLEETGKLTLLELTSPDSDDLPVAKELKSVELFSSGASQRVINARIIGTGQEEVFVWDLGFQIWCFQKESLRQLTSLLVLGDIAVKDFTYAAFLGPDKLVFQTGSIVGVANAWTGVVQTSSEIDQRILKALIVGERLALLTEKGEISVFGLDEKNNEKPSSEQVDISKSSKMTPESAAVSEPSPAKQGVLPSEQSQVKTKEEKKKASKPVRRVVVDEEDELDGHSVAQPKAQETDKLNKLNAAPKSPERTEQIKPNEVGARMDDSFMHELDQLEEELRPKPELIEGVNPIPEVSSPLQKAEVEQHEEVIVAMDNGKRLKMKEDPLFKFVKAFPQDVLYVGSSVGMSGRRVVRANRTGSITLIETVEVKTLEVEFNDTSLHRKLVLNNTDNFVFGDIHERGFLLASQGHIEDIDKYEDEEDEEKPPRVFFKATTSEMSWTLDLNMGDAISLVSVSSLFVFVLTESRTIRVYSHCGAEVLVFTLDAPAVSMASFEHFLAVVTLSGLPLQGQQSLKLRVYNVRDMSLEVETGLAISPYSKLQWFGYSDDGQVLCQDSSDCVRILVNRAFWVPVFENSETSKFWLIGSIDGELIGYRLSSLEKQPSSCYRYPLHREKPSPLLSASPLGLEKAQVSLLETAIKLTAEREKLSNMRFFKDTTRSQDVYRAELWDRIPSLGDISSLADDLERQRIEFIRQLLTENNEQAAIHYALQIKSEAHFQIVLTLLEKLKLKKPLEALRRLANDFGHFAFLAADSEGWAHLPAPQAPTPSTHVVPAPLPEPPAVKQNYFADLKQSVYESQNDSEKKSISPSQKPIVKSGTATIEQVGSKQLSKKDLLSSLSSVAVPSSNASKQAKKPLN